MIVSKLNKRIQIFEISGDTLEENINNSKILLRECWANVEDKGVSENSSEGMIYQTYKKDFTIRYIPNSFNESMLIKYENDFYNINNIDVQLNESIKFYSIKNQLIKNE